MANSSSFSSSVFADFGGNATFTNQTTGFGPSSNVTSSSNTTTVQWDPTQFDWAAIYNMQVQSKRVCLAFFVWVIYDYLLTIDDSINYFWMYRWSISRVLYSIGCIDAIFTMLILTLQIFLASPSAAFCRAVPLLNLIGTSILIGVVNVALISRVYALWNRSRRVLFIITTLVLVNLVCFIVLASIAYSRSFTFVNLAPFTGCLYMTTFTSGWVSLTIALTSETIIVILTFIRTYPIARQKTVNTPPLFNLLLQDGIFFYLLIMIAQVITLVSLLSPSVFSGPVLESSPGTVVLAIACNRMLVRLQKALIYTTQKPFTDASETESVSAEWTVGGTSKGNHNHHHDHEGRGRGRRVSGASGHHHHHRQDENEGAILERGEGEEKEVVTVPKLRKWSHGFASNHRGGTIGKELSSSSSPNVSEPAMVHRATVVTSQTQGKRSSMINVGMPTPQASAERVAGLVLDFDSGGEEDVEGKATGSGNGSGSGNGEETAPGTFSRPRRLSKTPPTTIASSSSKRRSSSTTLMTATSHGKSTQQQRSRSGTASTLGLGLGSVISDLTSSKRRKSSSAAAAVAAAMATRTSNDVGGDAGDLNGFESYSWTGASLDREIDLGGHYRSFSGLGDGGLRSPVSRDEREGPLDDIRGPRDEERGELEQEVVLEKSLGTRPGQDKSKASPVLAHIEQHQYTYYSHPYSYFSTEGDDEGEEIPLQETGTSRGSTSAHAPFSFSSESGKSVLDSDGMPKKSISSSGHGSSSTRESSGGIRVSRVGIYN